MKTNFILGLSLLAGSLIHAQVELDKPVQFTGTGSDARITGIESVLDPSDAPYAEAIQRDALKYAPATGVAINAYEVNLSPALEGSYSAGMVIHFISNHSNTGPATLSVNGLGTASIRKNFDGQLAADDIRNGQAVTVMFDGSNFQMLSPAAGGIAGSPPGGKQLFTTSGTFDVPEGVNTVWVTLVGGGGGGGGGAGGGTGGGGGGGAAYLAYPLSVDQPSYSITVGNGGNGGTNNAGNGGNGGDSSFGSLLVANGGQGGGGGQSGSFGQGGTAGAGGMAGQRGAPNSNNTNNCPGAGGSSVFGSGGYCAQTISNGGVGGSGSGYGGGGSAGGNAGVGGSAGGAGSSGFVLVEW
jgi:hypothetical protein